MPFRKEANRKRSICRGVFLLWVALALLPRTLEAQNLDIVQVKEGVYAAIGKAGKVVGANAAIILHDEGVTIVDTHISPKAARELVGEVKKLTDKPVTEVINTHFHFDHTNGNQVFFPQALIVGHQETRRILLESGMARTEEFQKRRETLLAEEKKRLAEEAKLDPAEREKLQGRVQFGEAFLREIKEMRPELKITPPNLTLDRKITFYRGGREIRVIFFGPGHTPGDVVVYLPHERVLCTGDLLVSSGLPYMADGYPSQWDATVAQFEQLDFETIIPGHGPVVTGLQSRELLKNFRIYLQDLVGQVRTFVEKGATLEETLKGVSLSRHSDKFSNFSEALPGNIERTYQELSENAGLEGREKVKPH